MASVGDRIRNWQERGQNRNIAIEKPKPCRDRISRRRKGRKRVKVISDLPHERLGSVPAGQ